MSDCRIDRAYLYVCQKDSCVCASGITGNPSGAKRNFLEEKIYGLSHAGIDEKASYGFHRILR